MSEYAPQSPDIYFSAKALSAAQSAGAIAVRSNLEHLEGLIDFINPYVTGEQFPGPDHMTFVAMAPSHNPFRSEGHLYKQDGTFPLYAPDQLSATRIASSATLRDLVVAERDILEFRPWNWIGSMTGFIARRMLGPPPADARIVASPGAWGRQITAMPQRRADQIQEEALRRFPHAVMIDSGSRRRVG